MTWEANRRAQIAVYKDNLWPKYSASREFRSECNIAMNYFAHGRRFVGDPYFLAGTAVPDWLSVVDRKVRARQRLALRLIDDADPRVAALARGVVQHHRDDAWFHGTRAFAELSLDLTVEIRDRLDADSGFRSSFLGHILVEILLDAELIAADRSRLDAYYAAVEQVDEQLVGLAVNRMATRATSRLALLIPRFSNERFLYDYLDDGKLLWRLNQVMRRVKLPALPDSLTKLFPSARRRIAERQGELLCGPATNANEIESPGDKP